MTLLSVLNWGFRSLATAIDNPVPKSRGLVAWLRRLRREMLPTDEELDRQYLEEATDLYDLETRMRDLDSSRRRMHGMLRHY
jgi:hypothetical protein